jgi:hypothetical protein
MIFSNVDLPAPLGPTSAANSPAANSAGDRVQHGNRCVAERQMIQPENGCHDAHIKEVTEKVLP